jgi:hypothetical protein
MRRLDAGQRAPLAIPVSRAGLRKGRGVAVVHLRLHSTAAVEDG